VAGFAGRRLLVVGDLMMDRFIWGSVSRISPEAPVPVVLVERESVSLGGAGNVARNVLTLGGTALPVGLRGDDEDGERLERLFREAGLTTEGLVEDLGRPTTIKSRVVAHHQQVVRFDREEDEPPPPEVRRRLSDRAQAALEGADAVIISDYDKGGVFRELLERVLPEAARRGLPIVIDPKVRLFGHYSPATVVTPNTREAAAASGIRVRTEEDLLAAGRSLLQRLDCPNLLVTRGEHGMLLMSASGGATFIPAVAREVFDVSGAGDTVAATLALALAGGAPIEEAAILANAAAGIVVGRLGTAAVTGEELQDLFRG
jgi:D-beta-D-heptose 7-phosphate kinase/D-beta-D-heptose 1-phosphate adenosyltransferase